jgi:hypothetical protein
MNLQAKKLEIVQLILNTEKPAILKKVEDVLKKEQVTDWWDDVSENDKKAINEGLEQLDKGEYFTRSEVRSKIKEKFNF